MASPVTTTTTTTTVASPSPSPSSSRAAAPSRTSARGRRVRALAATFGVILALVLATGTIEARLMRAEHATGYLLLAFLLVLAAFGARKKVSYLPLGTAAGWLRLHLALGVVSAAVLLLHTGFVLPNGALEAGLAAFYVLVAGSGALGLVLSRSFARRLSTRGQEVLWERIPALRSRLRERADTIVRRSSSETHGTAVADIYEAQIEGFLRGPANLFAHLLGSRRPVMTLLSALEAHDRYASEAERETTRDLREIIVMKDDLDFHFALQGVLKAWLFVHVPATCILLALALAHGLLAEAFASGGTEVP